MSHESPQSNLDPVYRSVPRGLSIAERGLDVAYLNAAEVGLRDRFNQISHFEYYGSSRAVLDLCGVSLDASETGAKKQRAYEFWSVEEIFTDEIMEWMRNPLVPKLTKEEIKEATGIDLDDFREAVAIADITEAGITYYPADINYVFNPLNIVTPERFMQETGAELSQDEVRDMYAETPTNVLFPSTWATQEFYHTPVGEIVLKGSDYDGSNYSMRDHKKRKMAWQSIASTPMPKNTPRGQMYTDFQEGSTANYYVGASRTAGKFAEVATQLGKSESAAFWQACSSIFSIVGAEEAGHRTYIRGSRRSAIRYADADVRSYAYIEWAKEIVAKNKQGKPMLYMPGYFIGDFVRGSVRAQRAGLYGRLAALKSIVNTLNASHLDKPGELNPEGEEAVIALRDHRDFVERHIGEIKEKAESKKNMSEIQAV